MNTGDILLQFQSSLINYSKGEINKICDIALLARFLFEHPISAKLGICTYFQTSQLSTVVK
jgi:hypothetical protein